MSRKTALIAAALFIAVWSTSAAAQSQGSTIEAKSSKTQPPVPVPIKSPDGVLRSPPPPWQKWGTFFVGSGFGPSYFPNYVDDNNDGSLSGIDEKAQGLGWSIRGGFEARYGGVELGYVDLGKSKFKAVSSGGSSWASGDVSAEVDASGFLFSALGRIPLADRLAVLARLGLYSWDANERFTENGLVTLNEENGTDPVYGAGVEYDVYWKQRFWIRGEFTHTEVNSTPVNQLSTSLDYHF